MNIVSDHRNDRMNLSGKNTWVGRWSKEIGSMDGKPAEAGVFAALTNSIKTMFNAVLFSEKYVLWLFSIASERCVHIIFFMTS